MGNQSSQPSAPAGVSPGDERAHWRAEADRHAKERNSLYEKSQVLACNNFWQVQLSLWNEGSVWAHRHTELACLLAGSL